jgi:NAD(P)H-dependent FMN reductase
MANIAGRRRTMKLLIILGSIRRGRQSPKVARYLHEQLGTRADVEAEVLDLKELGLPMMEERLKYLEDPPENVARFGEMVKGADRLLVVSPEYNGAPPGVLKNALDYLNEEYKDKPVGLVTVSAGPHGGKRCFEVLHTLFQRIGAQPSDDHLQVNNIDSSFTDDGKPADDQVATRVAEFLSAFLGD